jgi:Alpha/beta hydrolase domain
MRRCVIRSPNGSRVFWTGATLTAPLQKLFHVATAPELFEGRQSLALTDPLGSKDGPDPTSVRTFIVASTQHSAAPSPLPLPTAAPFGNYVQQSNPNPLQVFDFDPQYNAGDSSGFITNEPPKQGVQSYGILAPQADSDGLDLGGMKSVYQQAPIASFLSWNAGRKDRLEGGFCLFQGAYVPFAKSKVEREQTGDPRPSIEERYRTTAAYVAAIKKATEVSVKLRTLLRAEPHCLMRDVDAPLMKQVFHIPQ